MAKITEQSINAFYNRKRFKKQNMEVCLEENKTFLKLHGNTIAILNSNNDVKITTAGWDTNTTRNRLNGLSGVHVTSRKGELKLNGQLWDGKLIRL
jgi:hypothetical protein